MSFESNIEEFCVRMEGGDGYCRFFVSPQILRSIKMPSFPEKLGDWGPTALFRIEGGEFDGSYVAFTVFDVRSRKFLFSNRYLNVVAHHISDPMDRFSIERADHCGKTVLWLVG